MGEITQSPDPEERYLVVWQDTNGCRHFVGGGFNFLTQADAEERIRQLLAGQKKEHKITYEVLPYRKGHLKAAMVEYKIAG